MTYRLEKILKKELYASDVGPAVELIVAELQNDAGSLGAAALVMD